MVLWFFLSLLTGMSFLSAAPFLMLQRPEALSALLIFAGLTLPLRGFFYIAATYRQGQTPSAPSFVLCVLELLTGAALILLPRFSKTAFLILLELYLSLLFTIKAIDARIYAKARLWNRFPPAIASSAACAELFLLILFAPAHLRDQAVLFAVGLLLMVFGTGQLCEVLGFVIKNPRFRHVVNAIRVALPDYIGLLLPLRSADALPHRPLAPVAHNGTREFEVLFQTSSHGIGLAGHCELCIDGYTLTYGSYDPTSHRLCRTAGDGIVVRAPRERYLDWCIRKHHKKVISYTIRLDEAQANMVQAQLSALENAFLPWEPHLAPTEFAMRIQTLGDVHLYRVTRGPFQTYFIPSINCVTMTSSLLEKTGIGKALMLGIQTPGAYMDLLERQYLSGNSAVVARRVYTEGLQADEENLRL